MEQRYWYEILGIWIDATCNYCPEYRLKRNKIKRLQKKYELLQKIKKPGLDEIKRFRVVTRTLLKLGCMKDWKKLSRWLIYLSTLPILCSVFYLEDMPLPYQWAMGLKIVSFLSILFCLKLLLASELERLDIRNHKFKLIYQITQESEIHKFNAIWKTKQQVLLDERPKFSYSIDFVPGSRWRYHSEGFTQLVTKRITPLYQIDKPGEFNRLLGIK